MSYSPWAVQIPDFLKKSGILAFTNHLGLLYPEVLDYRGGNVMELETLPTFKQRWDSDSSLGAFQEHVRALFKLS